MHVIVKNWCFLIEEALYAQMWQADHLVKCRREEMENTLQIERNKEMLDVSIRLGSFSPSFDY